MLAEQPDPAFAWLVDERVASPPDPEGVFPAPRRCRKHSMGSPGRKHSDGLTQRHQLAFINASSSAITVRTRSRSDDTSSSVIPAVSIGSSTRTSASAMPKRQSPLLQRRVGAVEASGMIGVPVSMASRNAPSLNLLQLAVVAARALGKDHHADVLRQAVLARIHRRDDRSRACRGSA